MNADFCFGNNVFEHLNVYYVWIFDCAMNVNFMAMNGDKDLAKFLDEWWDSSVHDATYLQSEGGIWVMPYGKHSFNLETDYEKKFSGTYRRHTFIKRDFELKGDIDGGGYLILRDDKKSCFHEDNSSDYGPVSDRKAVVKAVTRELLG